jgi:hypothetical protein
MNNGASVVEAVKKLAASIAEDVTKGLEEEMLRFLIQNDQYNTVRPLIMSELYKQLLQHFFFSWFTRALSVLPDS